MKRLFLCTGSTVYREEPEMAVRLCPRMGGIPQRARTAVWLCPWIDKISQRARLATWLLLCSFTVNPAAWADTTCTAEEYDKTTRIKYIHDGDTVHLVNGQKVRLIGINTPEVAHGDKAAEHYSGEAKNALKTLFLDNKTISLVYGKESHDRYDRLLAHAFTEDGRNIQAALLEQGLARTITFPPNTQFSACYQQQERKARCARQGLWKKLKPIPVKKLDDKGAGFQLARGKLKNININNKGIWLNLDSKLTIGIRSENQALFDINAISRLLGENVVVRGWLNKSKRDTPYYIRVRHPSDIQSAAAFACD